MSIKMIYYLFTLIITSLLIIQILSSLQEHLEKLLIYTAIGQLSYFSIFLYKIMSNNAIDPESVEIALFYFIFMFINIAGFFYCTLSMKRAGNTYQVKSIYDLAQIWQIDKKITFGLIVLLLDLSSFPFFPGFTCRWFFIEEIYNFNKFLGILSFYSCIFSSYPYLRIINQMLLNKNLMLNKRGPRWYFDKLLNNRQVTILTITVFIFIVTTIKPSILWFLSHNLTLVLFSIL